MSDRRRPLLWLLVLLPLLAAVFLGLSPRPAGLDRALQGAHLSLSSGAAEGAARNLARVAAYLPWRLTIWEQAGLSALEAGDAAAAADFLQSAADAGHISPAGLLALGDAGWALGDLAAATRGWTEALQRGHDPIRTLERLLEAHKRAGDYTAAISVLQALSTLDPQDAGYRYQLGLMLAAREPQAALGFLLEAAELDDALLETVRTLEQDLAADPADEDPAVALVNAGRALARLGEWGLAREAFRQSTQVNPNFADAWAFLGEAEQQNGLSGRESLSQALALDPASLAANLLYGMMLKRAGDYDGALIYLEFAAAADPENPAVLAEIAGALAGRGDVNGALDYFSQAIEKAPDNPAYLLLMSQFSIYNDIQVDGIGLPAARRALAMQPGDPIGLDLIGYAYYLRSDPASARRFLLQSLQSNPNYAPARLHLGLVYLEEGKTEMAVAQFALAAELAPGSRIGDQAAEFVRRYAP